ncbi:hypothetical protein CS542_06085 [Pedobacter sp. IW39]|nr:hypothetical protein CS542_06085 [Pedobacter sp. IW39]
MLIPNGSGILQFILAACAESGNAFFYPAHHLPVYLVHHHGSIFACCLIDVEPAFVEGCNTFSHRVPSSGNMTCCWFNSQQDPHRFQYRNHLIYAFVWVVRLKQEE